MNKVRPLRHRVPSDSQGRTRVVQWCFAALSTIERRLMEIQLIDKFGSDAGPRREKMVREAGRWLDGLESQLEGREWTACAEFTVADILLASVLREIRHTDLLKPYPRLQAFYARAMGRPAWQCTLESYAQRLGVSAEEIR